MQLSRSSFIAKFSATKIMVVSVLLAFTVMVTSTASASAWGGGTPDYFDVAKPSATSQCEGGEWVSHWEWRWKKHHNEDRHDKRGWNPWKWGGHWVKVQKWQPNWKKLGFESKGQCIRYTSTEKPESKRACRDGGWWRLGFDSKRDCTKYFKLFGGGGYGGNIQNSQEDEEE